MTQDNLAESTPANQPPDPEIVLHRSALAEGVKIICFFATLALMVVLSRKYPETVQPVHIGYLFGKNIEVGIPLFGIVPLAFLSMVAHNLLNHKYVLGDDHITEVTGLAGFTIKTYRIRYVHVHGLEIDRNIYQRFLNLGDVRIGREISPKESEIVLKGIFNPEKYKEIIYTRVNKALKKYQLLDTKGI